MSAEYLDKNGLTYFWGKIKAWAKRNLVSDVSYDTQNHTINMTKYDGTNDAIHTTSVVSASTIVVDGGGITSHQDISGKADKVTGATSGHLAGLDTTGNLTDSGISPSDLLEVTEDTTYSALVALKNGGNLVPGAQYRITDYTCTTTQINTQSAGNVFDIIVTADSETELNENARAAHHSGDSYFANCDLDSWELKYCLENDVTRFSWVDTTNGKGVIYHMKDEWNNECQYDFKNIQFKRWEITACSACPNLVVNNADNTHGIYYGAKDRSGANIVSDATYGSNSDWFYTFSLKDDATGTIYDYSVESHRGLINENNSVKICHGNTISTTIATIEYQNVKYNSRTLNNIVFIDAVTNLQNSTHTGLGSCFANTFEADCYNFTFGPTCQSVHFSSDCGENTAGSDFIGNTFGSFCRGNKFSNSFQVNGAGIYFMYNTFGGRSVGNTFGNYCLYNTSGAGFDTNKLDNYCYSNTFGNNCYSNTFANDCHNNTFGNNCFSNTFGSSCYSNIFGNYCQFMTIFDGITYCNVTGGAQNAPVKNAQILNGTVGTSAQRLTITFVANKNYTQLAGYLNGTLRIWTAEDTVICTSSVAATDRVAVFDGTTGKIIKDGGVTIAEIQAGVPAYTIAKLGTAETGYVASYVLQKDGVQEGATINIPKDYLVKSGEVIDVVEYNGQYYNATDTSHTTPLPVSAAGKYLDFTINTSDNGGTEQHIYIAVEDLVDVYTGGNGIDIDASNVVSIDIDSNSPNGLSVTSDGLALATAVASSSGVGGSAGAMTAADKEKLDGVASGAEVNVQSNWTQTDTTADSYIRNKPSVKKGAGTNSVIINDNGSTSSGNYSLAQGYNTKANGAGSHSEGSGTTSSGSGSHAEGSGTTSSGVNSHSEGYSTTASGGYSHSEGGHTTSAGLDSHAEGEDTITTGLASHAEGKTTLAKGFASHSEGLGSKQALSFTISGNANATSYTTSVPSQVPQILNNILTVDDTRHAIVTNIYAGGFDTDVTLSSTNNLTNSTVYTIKGVSYGQHSHSEGDCTIAYGNYSHAEGSGTTSNGAYSHAEGNTTNASGQGSHSEGDATTASGNNSHAEGEHTQANGNHSHAEGEHTQANGNHSHAEGSFTYITVTGYASHAEGESTFVSGYASHVEGCGDNWYETPYTLTYSTGSEPWQYICSTSDTGLCHGMLLYYGGDDAYAMVDSVQNINGDTVVFLDNYFNIDDESVYIVSGANGYATHSEGYNTIAIRDYSHAEGEETRTYGIGSHAEGSNTITQNRSEHACGVYNLSHRTLEVKGNTRFSIGVGTSEANRKNAIEFMENGDMYVLGLNDYNGKQISSNHTLQSLLIGYDTTDALDEPDYDYIFSDDVDTLRLLHTHLYIDDFPDSKLTEIFEQWNVSSISELIALYEEYIDNGDMVDLGVNEFEWSGETVEMDDNVYNLWVQCNTNDVDDESLLYGLSSRSLSYNECVENSMSTNINNQWCPFDVVMRGDGLTYTIDNLGVNNQPFNEHFALVCVREIDMSGNHDIGDFEWDECVLFLDEFPFTDYMSFDENNDDVGIYNIRQYVDYVYSKVVSVNPGDYFGMGYCTYTREDVEIDDEQYRIWSIYNWSAGESYLMYYGAMKIYVTKEELKEKSKYKNPFSLWCPFEFLLNSDNSVSYNNKEVLDKKRSLVCINPNN